jgi:hypothetical protein
VSLDRNEGRRFSSPFHIHRKGRTQALLKDKLAKKGIFLRPEDDFGGTLS